MLIKLKIKLFALLSVWGGQVFLDSSQSRLTVEDYMVYRITYIRNYISRVSYTAAPQGNQLMPQCHSRTLLPPKSIAKGLNT